MGRPHTFKHGSVDVTFVMDQRGRCGTARAGDSEIPLKPDGLSLDHVPVEFHDALRELHNQIFAPDV